MAPMKFILGERVKIKELGITGRIMSLWITNRGTQYELSYFNNGKAELVYFF